MHLFIFFIRKCNSVVGIFKNHHLFRLCFCERTSFFFCSFFQNLPDIFFLLRRYYCTSRLNDSSLVLRNLFQRISDHTKMIHTDRCKCCTHRCSDDVRRIQNSSKTGLQYDQITFFLLKIQKSYCRFCFKDCRRFLSGRLHPGNSFFYFLCQFCKFIFRNPCSVNLNPLQIRDYCR